MQQNLLRFNKKQKYAIIDCEACSLNLVSKENVVWQWGILDCEGDNIVNSHNIFIKWPFKIPITKTAAIVTKFDENKVNELGIEPNKALEIVDSYFYNEEYKLIMHNGLGYDVYLHNIFRSLNNKKTDYSYINRVIDTNALSKGIKLAFPYNGKSIIDFMAYQYHMLSFKQKGLKTNLTALGKENNIEFDYDNVHDGIKDVELLFLVWNKYVKWNIEI